MSSVALSICIPTYNHAKYLSMALDSIINQATDEVEIVVSDNASTDNTEEIVRSYQLCFPRLIYHKNASNMGFDQNLLKVTELAKGTYCWLLGSDDALAIGSIENVFSVLNNSDIYLTDLKKMTLT